MLRLLTCSGILLGAVACRPSTTRAQHAETTQRDSARERRANTSEETTQGASTLEHRANTSTVLRAPGGTVRTEVYPDLGITLNKGSTLQREWITVRDSLMPLDFVESNGLTTRHENGNYRYAAKYKLRARDSVTAFEVRCSLFDVWGSPIETVTHTAVEDLAAGQTKQYAPEWNLYSETEALAYYASLCFVARVRTKQGRVVAANMDPILLEAEKFSSRFTPANLEPAAIPPSGKPARPGTP